MTIAIRVAIFFTAKLMAIIQGLLRLDFMSITDCTIYKLISCQVEASTHALDVLLRRYSWYSSVNALQPVRLEVMVSRMA